MTDINILYASWRIKGSYFNEMIHCGSEYNHWVEIALQYLPEEIFEEYKDKLAFISTIQVDACRVATYLCETKELILLSHRIFPKAGKGEGHSSGRYFIFAVLHEVAHAIQKHGSPLFDNLNQEKIKEQEKEANELALSWFNDHLLSKNPELTPLTMEEVEKAQAKNQELMRENI